MVPCYGKMLTCVLIFLLSGESLLKGEIFKLHHHAPDSDGWGNPLCDKNLGMKAIHVGVLREVCGTWDG